MLSSNRSNIAKSILLLVVMPTLFACSKSRFSATTTQAKPVKETSNPREDVPRPGKPPLPPIDPHDCRKYGNCPQPLPPPVSDCEDYEYDFPKYNGPKAVNVWVVLDGSKSNTPERYKQLLGLVEMYENTIAREIPIRLAVITGHSRQSTDSAISGNAFYKYRNEPYVLVFGQGQKQRNQSLKHLEQKILGMRTDNSPGVSDGGELLTVNLLAALRNNNAMRTVGKGDVLNLHFLGDENDICTIGKVEDFDKITVNGQRMSREFYARSLNCKHMNVTANGSGYSQTLADEINQIDSSGRANVHTSAFVYTNEATVPRTSATDENEVGRGIVDLVEATGGRSFDLATLMSTEKGQINREAIYAAGAEVMEGINTASQMYERIQIKDRSGKVIDTANMDYARTEVYVDGRRVEYQASADGYINLNRRCPIEGRKVQVKYCRQRR